MMSNSVAAWFGQPRVATLLTHHQRQRIRILCQLWHSGTASVLQSKPWFILCRSDAPVCRRRERTMPISRFQPGNLSELRFFRTSLDALMVGANSHHFGDNQKLPFRNLCWAIKFPPPLRVAIGGDQGGHGALSPRLHRRQSLAISADEGSLLLFQDLVCLATRSVVTI